MLARVRLTAVTVAALLLALSGPAGGATGLDDARATVERAKAEAPDLAGQALALARLAWPEDGRSDPLVAALAREQLLGYRNDALSVLNDAILRVEPIHTADVTVALIQARRKISSGSPSEYLPALVDAIWSDSVDAKRIAIPEVARLRFGAALMACIDAAIDHPELTEHVLDQLVVFGDQRARFFLSDLLREGPPDLRPKAAKTLAAIGGLAMLPLHEAALAPDPELRGPSIRALLEAAGVNELTVLYEYLALYGEDDPQLAEQVRNRAAILESLLEQRLDYDSASPTGD